MNQNTGAPKMSAQTDLFILEKPNYLDMSLEELKYRELSNGDTNATEELFRRESEIAERRLQEMSERRSRRDGID
jgi:hypothetical protein